MRRAGCCRPYDSLGVVVLQIDAVEGDKVPLLVVWPVQLRQQQCIICFDGAASNIGTITDGAAAGAMPGTLLSRTVTATSEYVVLGGKGDQPRHDGLAAWGCLT